MLLIHSCCFHCFHSCFASLAIHASTILPMQSTTLSYAINYSILKIFKSKLKFMQKHPFIDHHHRHQDCQAQVWDQHPHLVCWDHPAVHISDSHCSLLGRCLHVRNCHASCLLGTWHTKYPTATGRSGHLHSFRVSMRVSNPIAVSKPFLEQGNRSTVEEYENECHIRE